MLALLFIYVQGNNVFLDSYVVVSLVCFSVFTVIIVEAAELCFCSRITLMLGCYYSKKQKNAFGPQREVLISVS